MDRKALWPFCTFKFIAVRLPHPNYSFLNIYGSWSILVLILLHIGLTWNSVVRRVSNFSRGDFHSNVDRLHTSVFANLMIEMCTLSSSTDFFCRKPISSVSVQFLL